MRPAPRSNQRQPNPPVNVLLVDDQPANLLALEAILADLGQNLVKALSGEGALRCLLADDFAVVLLDVQMSGMDGFATARLIRARERSNSTPIVFLTAYDSQEFTAEKAYTLGAVDFLVKPLVPVILRAKVAVFVELFQKTRQVERQAEQLRLAQQERSERRVQVQYVTAGLLAESATLAEAAPRILRVVGENLGWDVGTLWTVDQREQVLRCAEFWHNPAIGAADFEAASRGQSLASGSGLAGRVWASREPAWIADVTRDANFPRANLAARAGLHGACALPIRLGREILGVLEFFCRDARPADAELFPVLIAISNQVGQLLERRRTEKAVRQSEARKAAILEAALDAIISIDADGKVIEFNPAAERQFGYNQADVLGKDMAALIVPPSLREEHHRGLAHYLATGEGPILNRRIEMPALRADGTEFSIELAITRIADEPPLFTAYIRDITAARKAGQALAERARLAEYGAEIGAALTLRSTLAEMVRRCAEATVRHLDAAFARIWTVNEAGDTLNLQASAGLYTHLDGSHSRIPVGKFKIGQIAKEQKPHLTNAVVGDPRVADQDWARREGIVAFAGYPLVVEDRLIGVIALFARHGLTEATLQALASVADQIAVGIDRKRAEDAECKQREWLHVTLSSVGDAVIATDDQGRVIFMNGAAESLTGWVQEEASGLPLEKVFQIVNEQTREPAETPVRMVIERGVIAGLANHTILIARDGTETPIADSAAPIRSGTGVVQGVVLVFRDVSDTRAGERERERLLEQERVARARAEISEAQLEEASRRKDNFLALLGHELRNPLVPIRNASAILGVAGNDPRAREQARDMIERQIRHLTRLVDELLDASRIANNKIQLKRERLDLGHLVRITAEDRRASLETLGLTLEVAVPAGPVWVEGDPVRLAQVVSNLIHNAMKFTDAGGQVAIRVESDLRTRRATVAIRDTGVGLEASMIDQLFEAFSQADRSLDRSPGGLGLGLALAKGLVRLHGGEVWAMSAGLGRGSEFAFWLPLAEGPAVPVVQKPKEASVADRGLRVLIIEDNRDAADSLRIVLELSGGHTVAVAYTGNEGVNLARDFRPDVVLCDLGLPGMSGFEVAQALRGSPATASARLIAVSGYGQEEDHRKAREAGFDHALVKPVELIALQRLLAVRKG